MSKMTKIKKFRFKNILFILSFFGLILTYSLLQQRISGIFPFIRKHRLNTFLLHIKNKGVISSQEFWQFREFYYPGVIQFNRNNAILGKPFLIFLSKKIESKEILVHEKTTFDSVLPNLKAWTINYRNKNEIVASNEKRLLILFVKPISEMSQANGFFDYKDKDKKILEGKRWYVYSEIRKD